MVHSEFTLERCVVDIVGSHFVMAGWGGGGGDGDGGRGSLVKII